MALAGYARISPAEGGQVMDRQLDALRAAGCQRVFDDSAPNWAVSGRPRSTVTSTPTAH
jgi:DNA invertase Pin-like site-specific DNA recombinase